MGQLQEAPLRFAAADDVPGAGVLCALPALLSQGLLRHVRTHFTLPPGFYPLETIFLVLAFMALARLRSVEALRYQPPGEWGRLLGLDRVPEVRTLRAKLAALCADPSATPAWSAALADDWIAAQPEQSVGVYYVDGHVRVYHGGLTALPRRYVSRQRLCLRGTTDYWVNAFDGQPFFVVGAPVDPGLLTMLRDQIVPRLLADTPAAAPDRPHLTLVFDREGYSPEFFAQMKALGVAVLTYHKFPSAPWSAEEFQPHTTTLVHGERVEMDLAERGTCLPNGLWLREVRRREPDGAQVSILSTDAHAALPALAVRLCARWCQENFFKYMREHFAIDRLCEHGVEPLPESTRIVNPAWRQLDGAVRRQRAQVHRHQAALGALPLSAAPEPAEIETWQRRGGELAQTLAHAQTRLEELKNQRRETAHHIELKDLPQSERFGRLAPTRKHFVDTIKLVAYRAETALAHLAREKLARADDARSLLRELFTATADLCPDHTHQTLTVRVHPSACSAHDATLRHLCDELTATESTFPGTDLRLIYRLAGST